MKGFPALLFPYLCYCCYYYYSYRAYGLSLKRSPALLFFLVYSILVIVPKTTIDIYRSEQFQHYNYLIQDPFFDFPTPRIKWVDPSSLVPHEHTSAPHLANLITFLRGLMPDVSEHAADGDTRPIPIPVVTASQPHVILDGHHRVAASLELGFRKIPVWAVDADGEEVRDWQGAIIRCYSRDTGSRMPIRHVIQAARAGKIEWGIKGTRHVAVVSEYGKEVELERVTPRVAWGHWRTEGISWSSPSPFSGTTVISIVASPSPSRQVSTITTTASTTSSP